MAKSIYDSSNLSKADNSELPVLNIVYKLCRMLKEENINYCHWKSNNALDRSMSGDNDLDLLLDRADSTKFVEILSRLGFKRAVAPTDKQVPFVVDYYGLDQASGQLVHVHAHYQLMLGHDMTKNYRLPIEKPYLDSAFQSGIFKVPEPEFEWIVFVVRMLLKHATWDVILGRQGQLKTAERHELSYLLNRINQHRVNEILDQYLPFIGVESFRNFVEALNKDSSIWIRVKAGHDLQLKLKANARRGLVVDPFLKIWRRAVLAFHRRLFKSYPRYCLDNGGAMIAIVGGDGAGKSTAVDALYASFSKTFRTTKIHMGKPTWSLETSIVRAILKIGQLLGLYPGAMTLQNTLKHQSLVSPGYPWLIRELCTARDRYWTYVKARRFASRGGLVILDRFPLPEIKLMDGRLTAQFLDELTAKSLDKEFLAPSKNSSLAQLLVRLEEQYYDQIALPEVLAVLRVDPKIAVERKTDEDSNSVHERSTSIWETDWQDTEAHVVDASQPRENVLNELKSLIWSKL